MTKNYDTDIIIKNGRMIDGMGTSWFHSEIYINKGKIIKIERDKKQLQRKNLMLQILLFVLDLKKEIKMSQSPFEMLEENVVDLMRQAKAPGISIGIILNGKLAYQEGFGARDLEKNIPMTPDTLYGIGSISKSLGALAIMKLYEQGELDLQDPVNKYVQ